MSHHIGFTVTHSVGGRAWKAVCTCGWESEPRLALRNAQELADRHQSDTDNA